MTKRDILLSVRDAGGSREVVADVARLYAFARRQPYLTRNRTAVVLTTYGCVRAGAEKMQAEGRTRAFESAMAGAKAVLDSAGLTPESRVRAIANAKRRRAAGTKGSE